MLLSHSTPIPPQPQLHPRRLLRHHSSSVSPTSCSFNPNQPSDVTTLVKMPTAPWMKGPILLPPDDLLRHSNSHRDRSLNDSDCVFTGKIVGKRGDKDVKTIAQSLQKLQEIDESDQVEKAVNDDDDGFGLEGIFEKLKLKLDADLRVVVNEEAKRPWDKSYQDEVFLRRTKKENVVTNAELSLDSALLYRLRNEARRMRKWVKVKKAGVTHDVVNEIKLIWRNQDLAMVKFGAPLCRNMDRACEIIEVCSPCQID